MNIKYLSNFQYEKKKNNRFKKFNALTKKQKVGLVVLVISVGYTSLFAQSSGGSTFNVKTIQSIIDSATGIPLPGVTNFYISSFGWLDIVKYIINYIVTAQTNATQTIASAKFGNASMFSTINNGVTVFAVIACGYKILMHYLKTERYDNVQAYTGFFSYIGILILFIFSNSIVSRLTSLNSSINQSAISSIGSKINNEMDQQIAADYQSLSAQLEALETEYNELNAAGGGAMDAIGDLPKIVRNRSDYYAAQGSFYAGNIGKYAYFSFFGVVITAVLAIPTFIMTLMVKILLSVITFGTKLVFLLAFIPGFENTWKTFILNLLHILLWIPIFNSIIAFILQIISSTMITGSMTGGQIVWLTVVSIICAYQAVSLTTSSAGVIINGAGAGMAGAMGSLAGFSAVGMAGQAVSAASGLAATAATGGAAGGAAASKIASKLSKD